MLQSHKYNWSKVQHILSILSSAEQFKSFQVTGLCYKSKITSKLLMVKVIDEIINPILVFSKSFSKGQFAWW